MKGKIEYYRDCIGCTASISKARTKYRLRVKTPSGMLLIHSKAYDSYRGAKIALGRIGEFHFVHATA